jgi:hypothetical protein
MCVCVCVCECVRNSCTQLIDDQSSYLTSHRHRPQRCCSPGARKDDQSVSARSTTKPGKLKASFRGDAVGAGNGEGQGPRVEPHARRGAASSGLGWVRLTQRGVMGSTGVARRACGIAPHSCTARSDAQQHQKRNNEAQPPVADTGMQTVTLPFTGRINLEENRADPKKHESNGHVNRASSPSPEKR